MTLPPALETLLSPVFDALPMDRAMTRLVPDAPPGPRLRGLVQAAVDAGIGRRPALAAGLWLYIDDLDASHAISQQLNDATGAFWHGIMHRREGDFGNSHYWFRRVGSHPAIPLIDGYDPHAFIDAVAGAHGADPPALVEIQRREWSTLFTWCAAAS